MVKRRKSVSLKHELESFDGKHVAVLESLIAKLEPSGVVIDAMILNAVDDDPMVQLAATWMLKQLAERGTPIAEPQLTLLFSSLPRLRDWQAKLHVCQMLQYIVIPQVSQKNVAEFLERELHSENKFVRAWAYSGLFEVARQYDSYTRRALRLIEEGEDSERSKSVKARLRAIRKSMDKASSKKEKKSERAKR